MRKGEQTRKEKRKGKEEMKGGDEEGQKGGRRDRGSVDARKEQGWDGVMEEEGDGEKKEGRERWK